MLGRAWGGLGLQPNRAMKVIQDWPMFVAAAKTKTLRPVLHASTPINVETKNQQSIHFSLFRAVSGNSL